MSVLDSEVIESKKSLSGSGYGEIATGSGLVCLLPKMPLKKRRNRWWRRGGRRGFGYRQRQPQDPNLHLRPPGDTTTTGQEEPSEQGNPSQIKRTIGTTKNRRSKRLRQKQKQRLAGVKRIRRDTQAAPSNNNEFLMQEHDHLGHFGNHHSGDEDRRSEELNLSSTAEGEDEFLARDFCAAYEVVHTERLNTMSKDDLIMEYQLLEERIEALENRIKTYQLSNNNNTSTSAPRESSSSSFQMGILHLNTPPESDPENNDSSSLSELTRLREENRKLIAENMALRRKRWLQKQRAQVSDDDESDFGDSNCTYSDNCPTSTEIDIEMENIPMEEAKESDEVNNTMLLYPLDKIFEGIKQDSSSSESGTEDSSSDSSSSNDEDEENENDKSKTEVNNVSLTLNLE